MALVLTHSSGQAVTIENVRFPYRDQPESKRSVSISSNKNVSNLLLGPTTRRFYLTLKKLSQPKFDELKAFVTHFLRYSAYSFSMQDPYDDSQEFENVRYISGLVGAREQNDYWDVTLELLQGVGESADTSDREPAPFNFNDQTNVEPDTQFTSNRITVSGIDAPAFISLIRSPISADVVLLDATQANSNNWTRYTGVVVRDGQRLAIRILSSIEGNTEISGTLDIGGITDTYSVTTRNVDTTPNSFSFNDQTNVARDTFFTSNEITVGGLSVPPGVAISDATRVSFTGSGELLVNGGVVPSRSGLVRNGDAVSVRLKSSVLFGTTVEGTVTIGGVEDTFSVATLAQDLVPASFTFDDVTEADRSTNYTSNIITVSGINDNSAISVTGGVLVNPDGTAFVGNIVSDGNMFAVRVMSSNMFETAVSAVVTIGGVGGESDTFTVTTTERDVTPDDFMFNEVRHADLSTEYTSNAVRITGINDGIGFAAAATVLDAGTGNAPLPQSQWTPFTDSLLQNGQWIALRIQSSDNYNTAVSGLITITTTGTSYLYTVSTKVDPSTLDTTPDAFVFNDLSGQQRNGEHTSNEITVAGINSPASITWTLTDAMGTQTNPIGTLIVNGDDTFPGGVVDTGDTVAVQLTASDDFNTQVVVAVTIGGVSESFIVRTEFQDLIPDAFAFTDVTEASLNADVDSDAVTITGINDGAPISITGGILLDATDANSANWTVYDLLNIFSGQKIAVRVTASSIPDTAVSATVNISGITTTFTVTTLDQIVENSIATQTNERVRILITAGTTNNWYSRRAGQNQGTVTGDLDIERGDTRLDTIEIDRIRPITSGTRFSIQGDGGNFANLLSAGAEGENAMVYIATDYGNVTLESSDIFSTSSNMVRYNLSTAQQNILSQVSSGDFVNVVMADFIVISDTTPDAFSFTDVTVAARDTDYISSPITIAGIEAPASISTSNGTLLDASSGAPNTWPTLGDTTVEDGDVIAVRLRSSASFSTRVDAVVTIGGVSDTFSITTLAGDTTPNNFSFTPAIDAERDTLVISDAITVAGINDSATISISAGGTILDATDADPVNWTTYGSNTVESGQKIAVRGRSSTSYTTTVTFTLTIGGVSADFDITTENPPINLITDPEFELLNGDFWQYVGATYSLAVLYNTQILNSSGNPEAIDTYDRCLEIRDTLSDREYIETVDRFAINDAGFYIASCYARRLSGTLPGSLYIRFVTVDEFGTELGIDGFSDTVTQGWSEKSNYHYWVTNVATQSGFVEGDWQRYMLTFGRSEGTARIPANATHFYIGVSAALIGGFSGVAEYIWQFTGYTMGRSI